MRPTLAAAALVIPLLGVVTPGAAQTRFTVHDAVAGTLANHPDARAAEAARSSAAAAVGEVRATRWPAVTTDATVTRFEEPMIVAPLHAFDIASAPTFNPTLVQHRLLLTHTLFDGGRRGALIGRAQAIEATADAGAAATEMALIERTTLAYLDALIATEVVEAVDRRVAALRAERDRVEQLFNVGRAARVVLLRADAALAQAEADGITARGDVELARATLRRLTGVEPAELVPVRRAAEANAGAAPASNPAVLRARERARAEDAAVRAARADWFPALRLSGGYVTFGSGAGDFTLEWQGAVSVSYPLFAGGARSRRVAGARARAAQAEAEVAQVELAVAEAEDRAVTAEREAEARVAALAAAVQHWSEVVRIEQLALAAGAGVQTDYLTAEAQLFEARAGLSRARYAAVRARILRARARGVLTQEWLMANVEEVP